MEIKRNINTERQRGTKRSRCSRNMIGICNLGGEKETETEVS